MTHSRSGQDINSSSLLVFTLAGQISSLQTQIRSQESDQRSQEDEMSRTKGELSRLQDEEAQLEQSLLSGRVQLDSIVKSLKTTQEEINQVGAEWRAEDALSEPRRWTQDLACKDSLCVRKGGKKRNLLKVEK